MDTIRPPRRSEGDEAGTSRPHEGRRIGRERGTTHRFIRAALAPLFGAALLAPVAVAAAPYTAQYVFGDSHVDRGNQPPLLGRGARPNPPSFHRSSTDGPTAATVVARHFGLADEPSLWVTGFRDTLGTFGGASFTPGTNHAVAGATAGADLPGVPAPLAGADLREQVAAFVGRVGAGGADPDALYHVFAGGNDIRSAALLDRPDLIAAGVAAELAALQVLIDNGARNLLVPNVQDIGTLPELARDNAALAPAATAYSRRWDALLAQRLSVLAAANPQVSITAFDFYTFNDRLRADADRYGPTDIADRCHTATPYSAKTSPGCGPDAGNISQFYWWDWRHPTARVHRLWGDAMIAALPISQPVPEPASGAVLAAGLTALATARARRRGG